MKIADEQDRLFTSPGYAAELGTVRALGDARWIAWEREISSKCLSYSNKRQPVT